MEYSQSSHLTYWTSLVLFECSFFVTRKTFNACDPCVSLFRKSYELLLDLSYQIHYSKTLSTSKYLSCLKMQWSCCQHIRASKWKSHPWPSYDKHNCHVDSYCSHTPPWNCQISCTTTLGTASNHLRIYAICKPDLPFSEHRTPMVDSSRYPPPALHEEKLYAGRVALSSDPDML